MASLLTVLFALAISAPAVEPLTVTQHTRDRVRVAAGDRQLFTIELTAPKVTKEATVRDEVFVLGDMVVVVRGARYPRRGQCLNPGGRQVEIFDSAGRSLVSRDEAHVAAAHGNRFASPSGKWGVLLEGESGFVYGYLFVNGLQPPRYVTVPELEWRGFGEQRFGVSGELVLPNMFLKGRRVTLIISADGSHSIE